MKIKVLNEKKPAVQSVERALDVLDCLAKREAPMRAKDIALALGLHQSTTHNLIRTLYRRGYLTQIEDGRYDIGFRCYILGALCDRWDGLRKAAKPLMELLSEETGDNSFLCAEVDGELITITHTEGSGAVVISRKHAWSEQMHCTAAGKILLAYDNNGLADQLLHDGPLERYTANTITDCSLVRKELAAIRNRGYSLCQDEGCEGVSALGVAVSDEKNKTLCALSQPFPTYYLTAGKISVDQRVAVLNKYARKIVEADG